MRCSSIFAMSILFATSAVAQINESSSLPEIEFSRLSQRDPNPLGEKALAVHPEQWKHGETDHFIYHFVHSYVVTPVSVEAEFHYRVVAKELERDQPPGDVKSHIYIFENPEQWQQFQAFVKLEPWTGGIHSQRSLFIQRKPKYKFSGKPAWARDRASDRPPVFNPTASHAGLMKESPNIFPKPPTPVISAHGA